MSLKRSRYDIVSEILELSNTPVGVNITKIVYSVNLNFKNAQEIISELIFKGMLEVVDGGGRVRYRTTKKGLEFLSKYENLVSF
ncbi:MAG: winged helix-turn-helix domain-containing protein [Candidatus Methanoglobus sp.]|jgi:predicted transcriptional regulator